LVARGVARRRGVDGRGRTGCRTQRARRLAACEGCGRLELAQLPLDVPAELVAVLRLEDAQFLDRALETRLLGLESLDRGALLVLGVGHEPRGGGVTLRDELVALLHSFAHVLLVQTARELQEVVGV